MVRLTALTLNMQNGQVWDPANPDEAPIDLNRTIGFLRDQDVDLMFLQEVEFPQAESFNRELHRNYDALRTAFKTYSSCFAYPATTKTHSPFGIGVAIFSRWPMEDPFHVVLPSSNIGFDFAGKHYVATERSLIGARTGPAARQFSVLNTHLQAYFMIESSSDEHPQQRQVVATVLKGRKLPTVLGGDFNCTAGESTVADFEACGMTTVQKQKTTWHRMPHVLDHIFYSEEFEVDSFEVIDTYVSDHSALRANLKLT